MSDSDARKKSLYVVKLALLEIRERARTSGDKVSYALSDLIHNFPGMVEATSEGKSWTEIFDELVERSERGGYGKWVQDRVNEAKRKK